MLRRWMDLVEGASEVSISSFIDEEGHLTVYATLGAKEVGRLIYDLDGEFVRDVGVEPEQRRKGVAWALYDWLEDEGYVVNPSQYQTPDGIAFWNARHGIKRRASRP